MNASHHGYQNVYFFQRVYFHNDVYLIDIMFAH